MIAQPNNRKAALQAIALVLAALLSQAAQSAELSGAALLKVLRDGGNTLVMRHANAPQASPDAASAQQDNGKRERQLDEAGKQEARAVGSAIKQLGVPITEVLSSPTLRARQTLQYAGFGKPKINAELDEDARGMSATSTPGSAWLKALASMPRKRGGNCLVVTHAPNIRGAFGDAAAVDPGEMLVVKADAKGDVEIIGRLKPKDWAQLLAP